jgi:Ser/Thr protein kinase RdoA (MazF antagonist)
LAESDISVGAPIRRADGSLQGAIETPDGAQSYAAFTFAEVTVEWPLSETRSHNLGAGVARMHLAANGFRARLPWRKYDVARLVDLPLERMLSYLGARPMETASLVRLGEHIRLYLARIPTASGEYGPIHGDIHQGNVHFRPDGELTFFDFSLCGVGWRAYDFTGFLWPMRDKTIDNPAIRLSCESFLAGYRSVRPMSAAEEAAIPAFVKIRDFWETGDWLECGKNLDPSVVERGIVGLVARFEATPLEAL